MLWGSEASVVRNTLRYLVRTPASIDDIVKTIGPLLRWCADFKPRDGRTGVLLTMGRDEPRMLERVGDRELRATSADGSQRRLRQTQELVLREIARRWRGELRTNPTWALGHRQLTVHGQGGAPMGDRGSAVTDPCGCMFAVPGLYVMDAAAFPTAVGVNPSATIAAVAERKVELFLQSYKNNPEWQAPERAHAPEFRDPLRSAAARVLTVAPPVTGREPFGVVGIAFKEFMHGYFAGGAAVARESVRERRAAIVKNDIEAGRLRDWVLSLEHAEILGLRGSSKAPLKNNRARTRALQPMPLPATGSIEIKMDAKIADLTALLEDHPKKTPPIALTGIIAIDHRRCLITAGQLTLFPHTGSRLRRLIEYEIEFCFGGARYKLYAFKIVEDDPRLDLWQERATLFFGIRWRMAGREIRHGVVRLPAKTFLKKQLESFEVFGTTDDERRMWALAAFATFFVGELADSYLPELSVSRLSSRTC